MAGRELEPAASSLNCGVPRLTAQAEGGGTEAGDADGTVDYKAIAARLEAEYNQAVHADQLVKLNVFVTTPAIPCFVFNALQVRQRFTP